VRKWRDRKRKRHADKDQSSWHDRAFKKLIAATPLKKYADKMHTMTN
jgi:hypothetical protein